MIATICKDGINADRNAMDYLIEEKTLAANDTIDLHIQTVVGFW